MATPAGPPPLGGVQQGREIDWTAVTLQVRDATYEAWNAHDADAVAAVFAVDARVRDATSPTTTSSSASSHPTERGRRSRRIVPP